MSNHKDSFLLFKVSKSLIRDHVINLAEGRSYSKTLAIYSRDVPGGAETLPRKQQLGIRPFQYRSRTGRDGGGSGICRVTVS